LHVGQQEDATNYPSKRWRVQLCLYYSNESTN
jgi:hypothetical protein